MKFFLNTKFRFLLLAIAHLSAADVIAAEVKLQCSFSTSSTYAEGGRGIADSEKGTAIIRISDEMPKHLVIIISGGGLIHNASVTTEKSSEIVNIKNFSNKNKWDLRNETSTPGEKITNATKAITVDRNAGTLAVELSFNFADGSSMLIKSFGNCSELDQKLRKF